MSATITAFRPPWAITCWVDDNYVYVEMPGQPIPYIQRHSLTEAGFSKALNALRTVHREHGSRKGGHVKYAMPKPKVTTPRTKRGKDDFSPEQRMNALAVLKKMGLK
jgi:hypothetical protein